MVHMQKQIKITNGALLAIQLGDIGDVVLTLPSLRALKTAFPDNHLVVCVREKAGALMDICADVDTVFRINKQDRKPVEAIRYQLDFFSALRSYPYDLAIDFRTGTRGAILALLSGAKARLGFFDNEDQLWRNRVFSHLVHFEYQKGTYVAEYYFEVIKSLGLTSESLDPELAVPMAVKQHVLERLQRIGVDGQSAFIVLQPFSLWQYKELHADKYVDLIDQISRRCGLPVILCGAANERQRAQAITDRSHGKAINLAGETTISQLAGLLSLADIFIGVDSAGLHIAAAVGTPTASIFGPSDPASWAPRGSRHAVIQPKLPCVPCRQKGCDNSGVSRCLDELSMVEMMATIGPMLDRLVEHQVGPSS